MHPEATLESCEISESENGVFLSEKGSALLHHCRIHDARDDGVWTSEATATLEVCEIGGCANVGVRVVGEGATATLHRCTLQENKVGVLTGGGGVQRPRHSSIRSSGYCRAL